MKKLKKILTPVLTILPSLAFMIGVIAANSACTAFYYQPETPDAMNAYRK